MQGDDDADEVVFVKEVLPPTPLKERAAQYQLPPSFYNIRHGPCHGCPGCQENEDDDNTKGKAGDGTLLHGQYSRTNHCVGAVSVTSAPQCQSKIDCSKAYLEIENTFFIITTH